MDFQDGFIPRAKKCAACLVVALEIAFCALTACFWNEGRDGGENGLCAMWIFMAHLQAFAIYTYKQKPMRDLKCANRMAVVCSTLLQVIFVAVVLYSVMAGQWKPTALTAVA